MAITFDGPSLLVELDAVSVNYTAQQIYSAWKDWVLSGNANWPQAFRTTGGDIAAGVKAPHFYYLRNDNGWRIKKPEATINVRIDGNLLFELPDEDRYAEPAGAYTPTVEINLTQISSVDLEGVINTIVDNSFTDQFREMLWRVYVAHFHERTHINDVTTLLDGAGDPLFRFTHTDERINPTGFDPTDVEP